VQQAGHCSKQVTSNITDMQRGATKIGSASMQVLSAGAVERSEPAEGGSFQVPRLGARPRTRVAPPPGKAPPKGITEGGPPTVLWSHWSASR
jgi:hypothetical protein